YRGPRAVGHVVRTSLRRHYPDQVRRSAATSRPLSPVRRAPVTSILAHDESIAEDASDSVQQQLEQRLLCVKPVLGLVPDGRTLAVEQAFRYLLAGMRGQAVQNDRVLAGLGNQRLVDSVGSKVGAAALGLVLVPHADPDVRV